MAFNNRIYLMRQSIQKTTAAFLLCAVSFMSCSTVEAGFLNDMYTSVNANANVNSARAYATQTANVVTGGGMVWKSPVLTSNLFSVTPPSISAGCGGIDVFMGGFSFINKAEFINMLKAVSQNAAGLLFSIALNAMSPELNSAMSDFQKKIQEMQSKLHNSCQMAKMLTDVSGASKVALEMGEEARNYGRSIGVFSDGADANQQTQTGANVQANIPKITTSGGTTIDNSSVNFTWTALAMGDLGGFSQTDKEIIQGILGTTVAVWVDPATGNKCGNPGDPACPPNTAPQVKSYAGNGAGYGIRAWVGSPVGGVAETLNSRPCGADIDTCLVPGVWTVVNDFTPVSTRVKVAMQEINDSIMQRRSATLINDGVGMVNPYSVIRLTTLPVAKLLNLTSNARFGYIASTYMEKWSYLIAIDTVSSIMYDVIANVRKQLVAKGMQGNDYGKISANMLVELKDAMEDIYKIKSEVGRVTDEDVSGASIIQGLENSLYANLSYSMSQSLKFSRKGK
jgi:conjugative transfer pilus assembly protein TraH